MSSRPYDDYSPMSTASPVPPSTGAPQTDPFVAGVATHRDPAPASISLNMQSQLDAVADTASDQGQGQVDTVVSSPDDEHVASSGPRGLPPRPSTARSSTARAPSIEPCARPSSCARRSTTGPGFASIADLIAHQDAASDSDLEGGGHTTDTHMLDEAVLSAEPGELPASAVAKVPSSEPTDAAEPLAEVDGANSSHGFVDQCVVNSPPTLSRISSGLRCPLDDGAVTGGSDAAGVESSLFAQRRSSRRHERAQSALGEAATPTNGADAHGDGEDITPLDRTQRSDASALLSPRTAKDLSTMPGSPPLSRSPAGYTGHSAPGLSRSPYQDRSTTRKSAPQVSPLRGRGVFVVAGILPSAFSSSSSSFSSLPSSSPALSSTPTETDAPVFIAETSLSEGSPSVHRADRASAPVAIDVGGCDGSEEQNGSGEEESHNSDGGEAAQPPLGFSSRSVATVMEQPAATPAIVLVDSDSQPHKTNDAVSNSHPQPAAGLSTVGAWTLALKQWWADERARRSYFVPGQRPFQNAVPSSKSDPFASDIIDVTSATLKAAPSVPPVAVVGIDVATVKETVCLGDEVRQAHPEGSRERRHADRLAALRRRRLESVGSTAADECTSRAVSITPADAQPAIGGSTAAASSLVSAAAEDASTHQRVTITDPLLHTAEALVSDEFTSLRQLLLCLHCLLACCAVAACVLVFLTYGVGLLVAPFVAAVACLGVWRFWSNAEVFHHARLRLSVLFLCDLITVTHSLFICGMLAYTALLVLLLATHDSSAFAATFALVGLLLSLVMALASMALSAAVVVVVEFRFERLLMSTLERAALANSVKVGLV